MLCAKAKFMQYKFMLPAIDSHNCINHTEKYRFMVCTRLKYRDSSQPRRGTHTGSLHFLSDTKCCTCPCCKFDWYARNRVFRPKIVQITSDTFTRYRG